jgi:hypothetical protein
MVKLPSELSEKLRRADAHLKETESIISGHLNGRPYRLEIEIHEKPSWTEASIRVFVLKRLPATRLGVVVGDVVHDLRSTLDQIAWSLTVQMQRRAPELPLPSDCWWSRVNFPIHTRSAGWANALSNSLRGTSGTAQRLIKAEQPFIAWKHAPTEDPLYGLHQLSLADKHRGIPVVFGALAPVKLLPEERVLAAAFGFPIGDDLRFRAIWQGSGPLVDGEILLRLGATRPFTEREVRKYMHIYGPLLFDVTFDDEPVHGLPVRKTLRSMQSRVLEIAARLTPAIRLPRYYRSQSCPPPRK